MKQNKLNNVTIIALCDVITKAEVAKLSGKSITKIKNLLKGKTPFTNKKLDKVLLKKLGWKICTCCNIRLVPKKAVNGQLLTRLCYFCWCTQAENIDEHFVTIGC